MAEIKNFDFGWVMARAHKILVSFQSLLLDSHSLPTLLEEYLCGHHSSKGLILLGQYHRSLELVDPGKKEGGDRPLSFLTF